MALLAVAVRQSFSPRRTNLMAGHGGLTKRHSPLQKIHYQSYQAGNKREKNLIARLKRRVRLSYAMMKRKAKRSPPREAKPDVGAINRLKALGVTTWNRSD